MMLFTVEKNSSTQALEDMIQAYKEGKCFSLELEGVGVISYHDRTSRIANLEHLLDFMTSLVTEKRMRDYE